MIILEETRSTFKEDSEESVTKNESCCFCQSQLYVDLLTEGNDSLCSFIGPILTEDHEQLFAHINCALFSSNVWMSPNYSYPQFKCAFIIPSRDQQFPASTVCQLQPHLHNLREACAAAKTCVCKCCHVVGASLVCTRLTCNNSYHYECALKTGKCIFASSLVKCEVSENSRNAYCVMILSRYPGREKISTVKILLMS